MKKLLSILIAFVLVAALFVVPATAENTGKSYVYTFGGFWDHGTPVSIPDPYIVTHVTENFQLLNPVDMTFVDGYLYILSGVGTLGEVHYENINRQGRIVVLNSDMEFVRDIIVEPHPSYDFVEDEPIFEMCCYSDCDVCEEYGSPIRVYTMRTLIDPFGIWVDGDEIFIADRGGHSVIVINHDGEYQWSFRMPVHEQVLAAMLQDEFEGDEAEYRARRRFLPTVVQTDHNGDIFLLSQNDYSGLMHLRIVRPTAPGERTTVEFLTYFGAASVVPTGEMWTILLWRAIGDFIGARWAQPRIIPNTYADFFISQDGQYIYVARPTTRDMRELVRRLNRVGVNVFQNTGFMGDTVGVVRGTWQQTNFTSVIADADGFVTALDATRNRLFQYTPQGWQMYIWGGVGEQRGTFTRPIALAADGNRLMVLDQATAVVTVMEPSYFGNLIRQGELTMISGDFDASLDYWLRVLDRTPNYQYAFMATSEIFYMNNDWDNARRFARFAQSSFLYSQAFSQVRSEFIDRHFTWVFAAFLILLFLGTVYGILKRRGIIRVKKVALDEHGKLKYFFHCLIHPVDGFSEMRYNHKQSLTIANLCMLLHVMASLASSQWWGWSFGGPSDGGINVFFSLAYTLGLWFTFVLANWLLGTFLVGKARFKELWICINYALVPTSIAWLIRMGLSNVLTQNEGAVLGWVILAATIWTYVLVFFAVKEIQMYGFWRTLASIAITYVSMTIVVFILLLMTTLVVQLQAFITSVMNEAMFRVRSEDGNTMAWLWYAIPIVLLLVAGSVGLTLWRKKRKRAVAVEMAAAAEAAIR